MFAMSLDRAIEHWNMHSGFRSVDIDGRFRWEQFTRRDGDHWAWMPKTAQLKPLILPVGTTAEDLEQNPWVSWLRSQRPPLAGMEF